MSEVTERQPRRERRTIYVVAAVVVVALVVVALVARGSQETTTEAEQKADQLLVAFAAAGVPTPDAEQVVRVLGDDGGATCEDPGGALSRATLLGQLVNGAAGPGIRPVVADNRVVRGQLLVIEIYCPDELAGFQDLVDGLHLDDTVRG
ncbi:MULTISPECIES: hypothetical protein [Cellulosimicrobium]|uniref:hypothetical protein n=1 Tax=Cellulosimicrobium TaxID=157920 RepID=UPI0004E29299|nr:MULTISPECIES: hypothetical protein [Cellulosimicrobium]KFD43784.1 hypothetical protein IU11_08495 [Cellulosimicrobium sp. MM]MCM3534211.1 hypothetical protein [Cellulosimicrobium funkei]NMF28488.1 hypothetical protein [Cellulosimicrobium aquatile]